MAAHRTLLYGTRGSDVEDLQKLLNKFLKPKPNLETDGKFGNITKSKVAALQRQCNKDLVSRRVIGKHLEDDGIVGPNTWLAFDRLVADEQHGRDRPNGFATLIRNGGRTVPHFSQGDPKWGSRVLGRGKSIAAKGCAMCSVAMCLAYYGHDTDPAKLDQYLDENGGYTGTSGNNIIWQKAFDSGRTPGCRRLRLTWHNYRRQDDFHTTLMERANRNMPTLVGVDYGESGDGAEDHWVVVVGYNDKDFIINDPAFAGGSGVSNPNREITHLYDSQRRGGLTPVRLCLFTA